MNAALKKLAHFVPCEACDGYGAQIIGNPNNPNAPERDCEECNGTGRVLRRIEPGESVRFLKGDGR